MPTRVINVGKAADDYVRLEVVKPNQNAAYMALAHCWGKIQLLRTLKANYVEHQKRIPLTKLTRTFRDAVEVTRQMGIQYLWIDSLCIVQDSKDDWEKEAVRMGNVSRFAALTITAAYSTDGNGGVLRAAYNPARAAVKCTPGAEKAVGHAYLTYRRRDFSKLQQMPLHTRAWVLQERILAPRTVHYADSQMLWECRTVRLCETGVPENALNSPGATVWDGRLHFEKALHKFWWNWYDLLHDFTGRGITHGDNRLPALSGIAHVMEGVTKGGYVARLWKQHFPWGLLWRKSCDWLEHPGHYRAPSWS